MAVPGFQEMFLPFLQCLADGHGLGVTTTRTIALKRIDSDYFEEA